MSKLQEAKAWFDGELKKLQDKGIPLVFFQDYKTKEPSVSFTMLIVSFMLCVGAVIAKVAESKLLGGLNFEYCLQLLMFSGALYFGRNLSSGSVKMESKKDEEK